MVILHCVLIHSPSWGLMTPVGQGEHPVDEQTHRYDALILFWEQWEKLKETANLQNTSTKWILEFSIMRGPLCLCKRARPRTARGQNKHQFCLRVSARLSKRRAKPRAGRKLYVLMSESHSSCVKAVGLDLLAMFPVGKTHFFLIFAWILPSSALLRSGAQYT